MRRHFYRAQLFDEVFCVVGFVGARRDRSQPVGTSRHHLQRGATRMFNLYRQTQSHLWWHAVLSRRAAFDGLGGVRAPDHRRTDFLLA
jgi:hypothetical protein